MRLKNLRPPWWGIVLCLLLTIFADAKAQLALSKLLFDNMHKVSVDEWDIYISGEEEHDKGFQFDDEFKLEIFKVVFAEVDGHQSDGIDYRLGRNNENLSKQLTQVSRGSLTGLNQKTPN